MRVLFLGTPEFAVPSLEALQRSSWEVAAVFTQPDRPAGRGQQSQAPPVKRCAVAAGIPVFQPEKIRAAGNRQLLESFHPDAIAVVAYGQILPPWLLELPRLGCVNVHGSLLPRYRGAAPIAWAILNGDAVTGITTMLMDEHLDTGPMLLAREVGISAETTTGELAESMSRVGAELLVATLDGIVAGLIKPVPQDDGLATLAPRLTKEMAEIDWKRDAWSLHNRIRGLNPWPLACTGWRGRRVQILRSAPPGNEEVEGLPAGTFAGATGSGMRIVCGSGSVLEVLELLPEGKKRVSGREFANGARLHPGQIAFG